MRLTGSEQNGSLVNTQVFDVYLFWYKSIMAFNRMVVDAAKATINPTLGPSVSDSCHRLVDDNCRNMRVLFRSLLPRY